MNRFNVQTARHAQPGLIATHSVLRNTYLLLSLTLLFSAATAGFAMVSGAPYLGALPTLLGYFGLLFLTQYLRNSVWGLVSIFALTGFMGYTLGPILNMYLYGLSNGGQIIMTALGGTGLIFFAMSGYVLTTRKDMSFMTGFIMTGVFVAFIASLAAVFFKLSALALACSGLFMFLSSAMIMWQTSEIIHGGERNYIMATITLYVSLYNIFLSLLNLLSAFSGRD